MMRPIELAEAIHRMLLTQGDEVHVGDREYLSSVVVDGRVDLVKLAAEIIGLGLVNDMDNPTMASLRQEFGYAPDERGGERWTVFQNHTLVVIHPERRPRLYKRGCGGLYYEIEPNL